VRRGLQDDRGAAALEFALLLPILVVILAMTMATGRLWIVRSSVLAVARSAGREAVLQPTSSMAADTATSAGQNTAAGYGLDPTHLNIEPQGPFGPGELYKVKVTYQVNLSDLPGLGFLPGSVTISEVSTEPRDPNK
jgi:Flp pilus assembly protein TadG